MLFGHLWIFFFFFFFKLTFSKKSFRNTISVRQFGSRSGLTFCQAWSGSKLFTKVINTKVTTSGERVNSCIMFSPKVLRTDPLSEQMTLSKLFCFLSEMESTLTHCILNRFSHTIYWKSLISILGTSGYEIYIFLEKMAKLFANSGDPDETPRSAVSDLGLHCLPITLSRVSRLQWDKGKNLLPFFLE